MDLLPIDNAEERKQLVCKFVSKSRASFLWARLVMDELEGVYGYESINAVLHRAMVSAETQSLIVEMQKRSGHDTMSGVCSFILTTSFSES